MIDGNIEIKMLTQTSPQKKKFLPFRMKKTFHWGLIILILGIVCCKEETVKKTTEGNVEIIHNKLRPYKTKAELTNFI